MIWEPHTMHAARLTSSERLKRVADLLADGGERSTLEIALQAKVCAVNSIAAELRKNGIQISKARRVGDVWYYRRTDVPPPLGRRQTDTVAGG